MATATHFSASTLSIAASGVRLPSLHVTLAYVESCRGDKAEWERRWRAVSRQVDTARATAPDTRPARTDERQVGHASADALASSPHRAQSPKVIGFAAILAGTAALLWRRRVHRRI
jgi:hypothetical protein